MKTFLDANNRTWTVTANVDSLRRVKDLAGVDLLQGEDLARVTDGANIWAMLELWPNVLWAFCLPEIQAVGMSQEQWAELLLADSAGEPTFEAAVNATLTELAGFFRKLGRRTAATALEKIVSTKTSRETNLANTMEARMEAAIETQLRTLTDQLTEQLTTSQPMTQTLGPASISSQVSSESTPAP